MTNERSTVFSNERVELGWGYQVEKYMYGIAVFIGIFAVSFTIRRHWRNRDRLDIAARLLIYKISLTVADLIVLFIYAPTQFAWISTYWWYGGEAYCKAFKFLSTFGFHLTGNMQVVIAMDRLKILSSMNKVKKVSYNPYIPVTIAWVAAFLCSIPQFFAFSVTYTNNGDPQCVSIWVVKNLEYYENADAIGIWEEYQELVLANDTAVVFDNGTLKYNVEDPGLSFEELEKNYVWIQKVELMYNICHILTIAVLPYMVEVICYLLIIAFLNAAQKGDFIGFKNFVKRNTLKLPCISIFCRLTDNLRTRHESSIERRRSTKREKKERMSERNKPSENTISADKRNSKSVNSSPTNILSFEFSTVRVVPNYTNGHVIRKPSLNYVCKYASHYDLMIEDSPPTEETILSRPGTGERHRLSHSILQLNGSTTLWDNDKNEPIFRPEDDEEQPDSPESEEEHPSSPVLCRMGPRRSSVPITGEEKKILHQLPAPWLKTVHRAKRNTKKKVFCMITLNLIFWMPYALHASISSLFVIEMTNHQFVCSLVVFNAISNIML